MTESANIPDNRSIDPILNRRKVSIDDTTAQQAQAMVGSIRANHALLISSPIARKTLPEYIFKNNFLPMFAGLETHPDINVGMWISIAGTPFVEVDIINDQGEFLFTVPPIFDRNIIDATKQLTAMPFNVVSDTVEKMIHQSPVRATKFLNHHLDTIQIPDEVLIKHRDKNATAMEAIFARYGVTPVYSSRTTAIGGGTTSSDSSVDNKKDDKPDLIYGDML